MRNIAMALLALAPVCGVAARVIHVETTGNDDAATGTKSAPFATIQAAIDASSNGDTILVGDGTFAPFAVNPQASLEDYCYNVFDYWFDPWNCPYIVDAEQLADVAEYLARGSARSITIRSRNGADFTFVDGGGASVCAVLSTTTNVVLSGFTLQGGTGGGFGGGAFGGIVEDSVITGNSNSYGAGGATGCLLRRCTVSGNGGTQGTAASSSILEDCLVTGNYSHEVLTSGGVLDFCTVRSCTIAGNTVNDVLFYGSRLENCIVWGNTFNHSPHSQPARDTTAAYSCLQYQCDGEGNIFTDPLFVGAALSDFRLQLSSPCIDAGSNALSSAATDMDGAPRVSGAAIDMGCYEFVSLPLPFTADDFYIPPSLWLGSTITPEIALPGEPPLPGRYATLSFRDNDGPGTGYAVIAGANGYTGTVEVPFEIADSLGVGSSGFEPVDASAIGWYAVADATAPDGFAARSPAIGAGASAQAALAVSGPGILSFEWRVSCNPRGHGLTATIDGTPFATIAGATQWEQVEIPLGGGDHVIEWRYAKGSTSAAGEDAGFVAGVAWTPTAGLAVSLEEALDAPGLAWTTGGGAGWAAQAIVTSDGVDAARSGRVLGDDTSALSTVVEGAGVLSFDILLDAAGPAGLDLIVDGDPLRSWTTAGGWARESVEIGSIGAHAVAFEFWNAGTAATASDHACVDRVEWAPFPAETRGTPVPVPYSWLVGQGAVPPGATLVADFEDAALADAANGENKVWECYVAGLAPTNPASRFLAGIGTAPDGSPRVTWHPDLRPDRDYTVLGRAGLSGEWAPTNSTHRFFKVKVEMR